MVLRTLWLERNFAELRGAWKHLSIYSELSQAADDKVRILGTKVENEAVRKRKLVSL